MATFDALKYGESTLENPSALNVIVGRNGAGKSRFLRFLAGLNSDARYMSRYLTPERSGSLSPDANIDNAVRNQKTWLEDNRRANQSPNFKQASAALLRELAMIFAARIESDRTLRGDFDKTFVTEHLSKINSMLSNVVVERTGNQDFRFRNMDGRELTPAELSSGESEIVALTIEVLHFFQSLDSNKTNVLLIDEPDVHLHPDLQARFARLLMRELNALDPKYQSKTIVCVVTHSTSMICELAQYPACSIGVKNFDSGTITATPVQGELRKLAPFFGHPLSQVISADVLLIVEGEDDERVWQQAARSSQGRLKIFPCNSETVGDQTALETLCDRLTSSIYENPRAFSIRDGDGVRDPLQPIGCVQRFRLQCYEVENLLLTDEALQSLGSSWDDFLARGHAWLARNGQHQNAGEFAALLNSKDRFRNQKLKALRNLIVGVLDSTKPWEVIVGKALGSVRSSSDRALPHGIVQYAGVGLLEALGLLA
jgi:energy-coupling factor transporter ATP-binding protein EcfA2